MMRFQLARADNTFLTPAGYNQTFTMHGTTMISCSRAGNGGDGIYLVPLMLGTRNVAFRG